MKRRELFDPIEPFDTGFLEVGSGHEIYYEPRHCLWMHPPGGKDRLVAEFDDVPAGDPYAPWIEELYRSGITAGCGGNDYCPHDPNTRGQMAVFLTKTFALP